MSNDYSKLLGRITEKFGTQAEFANAMGVSERSISLKLNNKVSWKDNEISKAVEILEVNPKDIPAYFFKYKVHETWTYKGANMNELGLVIVTIVNVVCALINLFCFIKDRMDWFIFRKIMNLSVGFNLDSMRWFF